MMLRMEKMWNHISQTIRRVAAPRLIYIKTRLGQGICHRCDWHGACHGTQDSLTLVVKYIRSWQSKNVQLLFPRGNLECFQHHGQSQIKLVPDTILILFIHSQCVLWNNSQDYLTTVKRKRIIISHTSHISRTTSSLYGSTIFIF